MHSLVHLFNYLWCGTSSWTLFSASHMTGGWLVGALY